MITIHLQDRPQTSFEEAFLPHLNAAHSLARWLTRNEDDAADVVQAYLRAFRFFGGFHGSDGRAWLLKIVRNTCYTWLRRNRPTEVAYESAGVMNLIEADTPDPESSVILKAEKRLVAEALEASLRSFAR